MATQLLRSSLEKVYGSPLSNSEGEYYAIVNFFQKRSIELLEKVLSAPYNVISERSFMELSLKFHINSSEHFFTLICPRIPLPTLHGSVPLGPKKPAQETDTLHLKIGTLQPIDRD